MLASWHPGLGELVKALRLAQVREAAHTATVAGRLAARITCHALRDTPEFAARVARGPRAGRAWLAAALAAEPALSAAFHEVHLAVLACCSSAFA